MPLQIPATSFVVFAQLMGGNGASDTNQTWHIADRDHQENVMMVSGFRQIDTTESCLEFAAAEAKRLNLGASTQVQGGPVTYLQFAADSISYSCARIEPAAAVVAVSGPEDVLKQHGYRFSFDR
ncbi:MAG: hypothetical protein AB8C46_11660 [Burkholderiaceae bacterium]